MTSEFAAQTRDMSCQGLEFEFPTTKKVIAAVLESGSDYRPDPKSRTAFEIAWHIASSEIQMLDEVADGTFTMDEKHKAPATVEGIVAFYEEQFPRALARVKALTAEQLATPTDFYGAFNYPLFMYLGFVMCHSVHHRGQLSTYLRPLGSKVPGIYGGSADEPWQG